MGINTRVLLSLLVSILWLSGIETQPESGLVCPLRTTSAIQVSLNSLRSQRGNWITKLSLERGGGRGGLPNAIGTEPWTVDVDSNTRTCEGAESTLHVTLTLTAPLPKASPDYELFPGIGYYKFHTEAKIWSTAQQTCAEEGTHLVIVNSEKEDEVIKTLIARNPTIPGASNNDWFWVGVERKSGEYFTIFGDGLNTTGFARWHPGQPNKGAQDNCILVHRTSGLLGDVICDWKVAFICEKEL